MQELSNIAGSSGSFEVSGEIGYFTEDSARKKFYIELMKKADTVPLSRLFAHYNIKVDRYNRKIICPFRSHKNGRESTPSFYYYPDNNSFRCYGCNVGNPKSHAVEFMAAMEEMSRSKAAQRILNLFSSDVDEDAVFLDRESYAEKLDIILGFSNIIKEFRLSNNDNQSSQFIEDMCQVYDIVNARHNLGNKALNELINILKHKINTYELSNLCSNIEDSL